MILASRGPSSFKLTARAGLLFALAALLVLSSSSVGALTTQRAESAAKADKIAPVLRQELSKAGDGKTRYLVLLSEQADVSNDIVDWNAKGQYVLDALRATARATHPRVEALLSTEQKAGNVERFKGYYIVNAFQVVGNLRAAERLAATADVASIEEWPVATLDATMAAAPVEAPEALEWNVSKVRAPEAWAMGYDGTGIVIGGLDTGVRYTHAALVNKYRGNLGGVFDHNYSWWNSVGTSQTPTDADGHGTHTIGTALGDDGVGNQVGIAPGARWIATNGIATGATDADIVEAGEWMLAPWNLTGNRATADASKRPHVVSNSWGYGTSSFNCSTATIFRLVVQNWVAAGIFPSFSAGNAGTTGNRPPAAYPETFETGNIDINNLIASSSSRGPSCFDGKQHPQVVAGGSNVRSAYITSNTAYSSLTGTSMSQPATAGAVAILKQANPNLTIQQTWYILTSTTYFDPAWGAQPNGTYGWGLIQIDAAVQAALNTAPPTPTPTATATPVVPDFSLSVTPSSRTIVRGQSTTYSVALGSLNGFTGNVSLSVSGLPTRGTASFSPNPVALASGGSGASTLTITTDRRDTVRSYTLTITGSGGGKTHSQTVTLVLNK